MNAAAATLPFSKYHGLGNDFVLVDGRASAEPPISPADAVAMPTTAPADAPAAPIDAAAPAAAPVSVAADANARIEAAVAAAVAEATQTGMSAAAAQRKARCSRALTSKP